jgi:hypothetical protein
LVASKQGTGRDIDPHHKADTLLSKKCPGFLVGLSAPNDAYVHHLAKIAALQWQLHDTPVSGSHNVMELVVEAHRWEVATVEVLSLST